jgi:uncharacterized membrane protein YphA (DoxX/SURF4 family)
LTRRGWLLLLFRVIVGGVFLWAGALKIADPLEFAQNIQNYRTFPHGLAFLIAVFLPWVEVLSGAFLILGLFKRSSALVISLLLAGFIGLVALALVRGIDTSCGCFGTFSRRADLSLVLMDTILLALALTILFARPPRRAA